MKNKIVPLSSVVLGSGIIFTLADTWAVKAPALALWLAATAAWVKAVADRRSQA